MVPNTWALPEPGNYEHTWLGHSACTNTVERCLIFVTSLEEDRQSLSPTTARLLPGDSDKVWLPSRMGLCSFWEYIFLPWVIYPSEKLVNSLSFPPKMERPRCTLGSGSFLAFKDQPNFITT